MMLKRIPIWLLILTLGAIVGMAGLCQAQPVPWSLLDQMVTAGDGSVIFVDSVTGLDADSGLTFALAKLTISGAVTAVDDGGVIIVFPGSYDETVDLDAANKSITIMGTSRDACIITRPDNGDSSAVKMESDCALYNLTINSAGTTNGDNCILIAAGKSNLLIDNCTVVSTNHIAVFGKTALSATTPTNLVCRNSSFTCQSVKTISISTSADRVVFQDCYIYNSSTGTIGSIGIACINATATVPLIIQRCYIETAITSDLSQAFHGLYLSNCQAVITDSYILAGGTGAADTNAYAVYIAAGSIAARFTALVSSAAGGASAYDIGSTSSTQEFLGAQVFYDTTKTENVTDRVLVVDTNGRVDIGTVGGATPMTVADIWDEDVSDNTTSRSSAVYLKQAATKR